MEVSSRRDLESITELAPVMKEAKNRLGDSGRLLVRYSGTQLLCRVMAEGPEEETVQLVVDMVADAIARHV